MELWIHSTIVKDACVVDREALNNKDEKQEDANEDDYDTAAAYGDTVWYFNFLVLATRYSIEQDILSWKDGK